MIIKQIALDDAIDMAYELPIQFQGKWYSFLVIRIFDNDKDQKEYNKLLRKYIKKIKESRA